MRHRVKIGTTGYAEADMYPPNCERVGGRLLPKQIDVVLPGDGVQPRLTARLALVDGVPQCRQVSIDSVEGGREVKQLDLRAFSVADMVENLYAAFSAKIVSEKDGYITTAPTWGELAHDDAVRDIMDTRKGKGARKITEEFLREVAQVYVEHADKNPTQAVQRRFEVSPRMAGNYIRRARDLDLLPEVTDGRRKG